MKGLIMITLALVGHLELAKESRDGSGQPITLSAVLVTLGKGGTAGLFFFFFFN